jgi:hypothetical protein
MSEPVHKERAAAICGVGVQSIDNWIESGHLAPTSNVGKPMFRMSDLDRIRALRVKYGKGWVRHIDDDGKPESSPASVSPPNFTHGGFIPSSQQPTDHLREVIEDIHNRVHHMTPAPDVDELSLSDRTQIAICQKLIRRARELDKQGKRDAAIELLWTVIDEVFEERPAA